MGILDQRPLWQRLRRFSRLGLLLTIRYTPLPWTAKRWLIWLGGPKVLLSACALIEEDGRVLSLRSRYSGDWQLPGGCVRRREPALAALQRECLEELGLHVRGPELLGIYVDMQGLAQCALFRCRLDPGTVRLSEEHTDYAYLPPEQLPPPLRRMLAHVRAGSS